VNDELGGAPVVITFCPLCGSGLVFSRLLESNEEGLPTMLTFSNTSALYQNDMVMVDRETGSYWWQVAGSGIVGPLGDSSLSLLPAQTTTWASWREQYPNSAVMVRPTGGFYDNDAFANYGSFLDAGRTPFPVRPEVFDDDRLAPSARVIVAVIGGETRAWATSPARQIEELVGGEEVIVTLDGTGGRIVRKDDETIAARSAFWFAVVSTDPGVTLGG
jgi:hypothetical protein